MNQNADSSLSDRKLVGSRGSMIFLILLVVVITLVMLLFVKPIPQWPEYHQFADVKTLIGIPNALNVLSNLGFLVVGLWGMWAVLARPWNRASQLRICYVAYFTGILLTGLGSSWYHLEPTNESLMWDRLPMAITAMSLLAMAISEFLNPKAAHRTLWPLLLLGVASVIWWAWTESQNAGDLRPYALIQFLPAVLIVAMMILYNSPHDFIVAMIGLIVFYGIAKVCEHFDSAIYQALKILSGHSLKHLFASIASAFLLLPLYRSSVHR